MIELDFVPGSFLFFWLYTGGVGLYLDYLFLSDIDETWQDVV